MPDFTSRRTNNWDGFDIEAKMMTATDIIADKLIMPGLGHRELVQAIVEKQLVIDAPEAARILPVPTGEELERFEDENKLAAVLASCVRKIWQLIASEPDHTQRAVYAVTGVTFSLAYDTVIKDRFHRDRNSTGASDPGDLMSDGEWIENTAAQVLQNAISLSLYSGDTEQDVNASSQLVNLPDGLADRMQEVIWLAEIREFEQYAEALRSNPKPDSIVLPLAEHWEDIEALEPEPMRRRLARISDIETFVDFVELSVRETIEEMQRRRRDYGEENTLTVVEHNTTVMYLTKARLELLEVIYGTIPLAPVPADHIMHRIPVEKRRSFAQMREVLGNKFGVDDMLQQIENEKRFDALIEEHGPILGFIKWQAIQAKAKGENRPTQGRRRKDRTASKRLSKKDKLKLKKERDRKARKKKREGRGNGDNNTLRN